MTFQHVPVLLKEVLAYLVPHPGGMYIDGTAGGGGHARAILERAQPGGRLLALDRDPTALAAAQAALAAFGQAAVPVQSDFRAVAVVAAERGFQGADGVLFDLGVSSPQLDVEQRGFSYMQDAPLDMRMDPSQGESARDLINGASEAELTRIIREFGEERWAARIAHFIAERRRQARIETTGQLVDVIKAAIPAAARREGPHPAKRTFQALRIAINDELGALKEGLAGALAVLRPGGRLGVISFHSLEDRIVKQAMALWARRCTCPPEWPICRCAGRPLARVVTRKPVVPAAAEVAANPRSRSAKLRVAEKV